MSRRLVASSSAGDSRIVVQRRDGAARPEPRRDQWRVACPPLAICRGSRVLRAAGIAVSGCTWGQVAAMEACGEERRVGRVVAGAIVAIASVALGVARRTLV